MKEENIPRSHSIDKGLIISVLIRVIKEAKVKIDIFYVNNQIIPMNLVTLVKAFGLTGTKSRKERSTVHIKRNIVKQRDKGTKIILLKKTWKV